MSSMLVTAPLPDEAAPLTRLGGRPLAPAEFVWPRCASCKQPLQFLAQVRLRDVDVNWPDRLLLLFACVTVDTFCEVNKPDSEGNHAACVDAVGSSLVTPPTPLAMRRLEGVSLVPFDSDYEVARDELSTATTFVYGQVGEPATSVSGFVPACAACREPMQFVAQLEEGPDADSQFPFNGTTGFAYVCGACFQHAALFIDDFY
jgi:hypothetical protein